MGKVNRLVAPALALLVLSACSLLKDRTPKPVEGEPAKVEPPARPVEPVAREEPVPAEAVPVEAGTAEAEQDEEEASTREKKGGSKTKVIEKIVVKEGSLKALGSFGSKEEEEAARDLFSKEDVEEEK